MNILIAGASGFIGQHLVKELEKQHSITVLGRDIKRLKNTFHQPIKLCNWDALDKLNAQSYNAVINLCGHNIGASRWNPKVKQLLIDSRVKTCSALIKWAIDQNAKPHFYTANAIGIYGLQKNGVTQGFDENSPIDLDNPPDFLAEIGALWQKAMQPAIDQGMPVTITRFGVVLKKEEGMLKKLSPSFYLGMGAIIGDGKQVLSWIHIDDLVAAYSFLLAQPKLIGNFNLTAPFPLSQAKFAQTLAKAMHRPLFLKIPAILIRKLFGEMGECLLLRGQRVLPKRLLAEGFVFQYPKVALALNHEFESS
ncbi:MAG: TIGR01777 family protein [Tatlockia sp.]|nr:TIGR01777 family protein [Tatlockia sp.]